MAQVTRIHKNTVKAQLRRGKPFKGYLSGSNINDFHIIGGWCLGVAVEVATVEELEKKCSGLLRNLEPELGSRIVCWQ